MDYFLARIVPMYRMIGGNYKRKITACESQILSDHVWSSVSTNTVCHFSLPPFSDSQPCSHKCKLNLIDTHYVKIEKNRPY